MKKEIDFVKFNITKKEFNEMMGKIDETLKDDNVPIYARPLRSFSFLSEKLKANLLITSAEKLTDNNVFTNYNIAIHVDNWFESMYGDRININLGPGSIVLLLKSDPWEMRIPLVLGKAYLVCDPNLDKYRNIANVTTGPPPKRNILLLIENISNAFASSLSQEELVHIMKIFSLSLDVLPVLKDKSSFPFINDAISDFNSSVFHIFENPPHFGLSKWASLQFVEKLIKSHLKLNNCKFPKDHDIKSLAQIAFKNGMRTVPESDLDAVYCKAGVRYGEQKISLNEAVEAHHAAIRIAHKILVE